MQRLHHRRGNLLLFLQQPLISSHLHNLLHRTICASVRSRRRLPSRGNAMTFLTRFVSALAAVSMSGAMLSLAVI
jgi:hypothetical protein